MANSDSNKRNNSSNKIESINPLVDPFHEPCFVFFKELDKVEDMWNDSASNSFRHEVTEYSRKTTKEYLEAVNNIFESYSAILSEAQKLKKWNAGFGQWMSFLDLSVVAERGISRLFFNRDDHRF